MNCKVCGGTILGDGVTKSYHCEFADESLYEGKEPDASITYCVAKDDANVTPTSSFTHCSDPLPFDEHRWSEDPQTPHARLRVFRSEDDGCVTFADEDCTSRSPTARPLRNRASRICMVRTEAVWLRDTLTKLLASWSVDDVGGTLAPPAPPAVLSLRTCNRHVDCDAADEVARVKGRRESHCHDDCCEDCFGQ